MTWLQLWKRIGKQRISKTQNRKVMVKLPDGSEHFCKLVFTNSGEDWHLEFDKENIKEK